MHISTIERRARLVLSFLCLAALAAFLPSLLSAAPAVKGMALANAPVAITPGLENNLDNAMKVIFEDSLSENFVTDSDVLDVFEQDSNVQVEQTTGGKYITLAHYFQLPTGVGARVENDYIPVPEGPVVENSRINLRKIMGSVEMYGDVMRKCKQGLGAFLTWGERAMPDLVRSVSHQRDRMLLGYGNGAKARVNQAGPFAANADGLYEVEIDSSFGVAGYTDAFLNFVEGERAVFSPNPDGSALRAAGAGQSAKIKKIDQRGNTLYFESLPAGLADNDFIFAGDAAGASVPTAGGEDREIMGLLGMVDDGTILTEFQGLNRADYTPWNSIALNAQDASLGAWNTGTLNEDLLGYADDETSVLGGGEVSMLLTSRSGVRSYWRSRKNDPTTHRTLDERSITGGKGKGVKILLGTREVLLRALRKMPPQLCFGLSPETFKRWQLKAWEWDDTTGSVWKQSSDGVGRKDSFWAYGYAYMQTGCIAPRKNFVIRNLLRA